MPAVWSYSRLSLYTRCPRGWKFRYVDGLPGQSSPAATRGIQVHEWIEAYSRHCHEHKATTDYDAGRALMASYAPDVRDLCTTFMEREEFDWSLTVADGEGVERAFRVPLPDGLGDLRGRVDRVEWNDYERALWVTDFKSGFAPEKPERCPPQLVCYAWAMHQVFPAAEVVVPRYLYIASMIEQEWELYEPRPDWAVSVVRRVLADTEFRATPSPTACAWCDYTHLCPVVTADPLLHPTTDDAARETWGQHCAVAARAKNLKAAVQAHIGKGNALRLADGTPGPGYYPTQANGRFEVTGDPVEVVRLVLAGLGDDAARGLIDAAKLGKAREALDEEGFGDAPELEGLEAHVREKNAGGERWSDSAPKWLQAEEVTP